MNKDSTSSALYYGLFLILAVFSIYFFKERLFVDSSYMIFKAINKGWFHIEHGRPAHAVSQIFPLIGYALHLPLKALLILYSLGQVMMVFLFFLIFDRLFKNKGAIIALLGILVVGQKWLYFIPMLEIVFGGIFGLFCFSIMRSDRWKNDLWFMILLLSYWILLTSHPLNYLLSALLIALDAADRGWIKKLHFSMAAFFLLAIFIEWLGHDAYEAQKFVALEDSGLKNLFSPTYLGESLLLFFQRFWLLVIIGIVVSIRFYIHGKKLLAWVWPVSFLLLLLAAVYRWDISQDDWYTELVFQPLVSITFILFSFFLINELSDQLQRKWLSFFSLVFLGFIISIVYSSEGIQDRTEQLSQLGSKMQQNDTRKAIIQVENIERPYNNWTWSAPVEVLLLSSTEGPNSSVSLISEQDLSFNFNNRRLSPSKFVFRKFEVLSYEELNDRYFNFEEGNYQRINTTQLSPLLESNKESISIYPNNEDSLFKVKAGVEHWVDVVIENSSDENMASSLESKLYVAPHWFINDTMHAWDGLRTPLELDIKGKHQQKVRIQAPKEKGIYEIQFDVVKEGAYWLELQPKYLVQVY